MLFRNGVVKVVALFAPLFISNSCKPSHVKADPNWTFEVNDEILNGGGTEFATGLVHSDTLQLDGVPEGVAIGLANAASTSGFLMQNQDGLDFRKFGLSPVDNQGSCGVE